jgi:hypothetical protein
MLSPHSSSQDRSHDSSRRNFIRLVGGGAVAAAVPLTGCTDYPDSAVEAWQARADEREVDMRRFALANALLAPNPHNRQPWIADLRRAEEITLFCDRERLLPETDPFGRQILIGCGAFIELAVLAAAERGYRTLVAPFPDGEYDARSIDERPVARLVLVRDAGLARDPLFAQIRRRHTNKGTYDGSRRVDDAVLAALRSAASAPGLLAGEIIDAARVAQVRKITRDAFALETTTPRTYLESARLLRIGPSEIERHRDGISLMAPMPRLLTALGLLDRLEVPTPGSAIHATVMRLWEPMETGSGYVWIAAGGNARHLQLAAGRAYVRAHLTATAAGIDMHPLSQALQEFPEVRPQFEAIHRLLGFDPAQITLQMLARIGYGTKPAPATPRRDLAQLLRL